MLFKSIYQFDLKKNRGMVLYIDEIVNNMPIFVQNSC